MPENEKVMIVEGKSDKQKVKHVIEEPVDIICTNGTISQAKLDEFAETLFDKDVYILVDADESGEKLRRQLKRELPKLRIYTLIEYTKKSLPPRVSMLQKYYFVQTSGYIQNIYYKTY